MSQRPTMDSLFSNDPFFSQERLLWPLHQEALSSLQQDFFHRRTKLAEGLLKELDGPHLLDLHQGAFPRALFASLGAGGDQDACCALEQDGQPGPVVPTASAPAAASGAGKDLLVTLDVRGYAPEDIHVKLEGRRLAVVAMKRAAAEASHDSSSASRSSSQRSASSCQAGFVQNIELPAHLDLSALSCTLTEDGRLRVDAPVARQPITESGEAERPEHRLRQRQEEVRAEEREEEVQAEEQEEVPERFTSSLEFPITKDN
ncbi:Heat shock protein beta-9 [Merluccius polli]|uniref:Heat shock protein beta-9 n=1 Tax=Merluccius polli TaxID=89951 RepID=A0AA47N3S3_MERPO|nr:Heat shock protein beta-9 [Merluccius polli]